MIGRAQCPYDVETAMGCHGVCVVCKNIPRPGTIYRGLVSRLTRKRGREEGERDEIKSRGQIILVSRIKLRWTSVSDVGTPRDGRTIQRDYPAKTRGRNAFMVITTLRYGGRHVRDKTNSSNVNLSSKERMVKHASLKEDYQSIDYFN